MELSDKYETFLEHIDDEIKFRKEHIKFMKESIFDQEIILFWIINIWVTIFIRLCLKN